jgi:biopolymer transport protein ExbB
MANTRKYRILSSPLLLAVIAILRIANASFAADVWWNDKWPVRKKITIDLTASGVPIAENVGSPAVLIRLHSGNFGFACKEDGSDLRFVAADGKTALPFHIESINPVFAEAFIWVKVPDLKPGAQTVIWLYYGNQGPDAVKADDAKGTYDSDMALVYHFAEKNAAPTDSTGNPNTAMNAGNSVDAMIASGIRLGPKGAVKIPATTSLVWRVGGALTWSAWVKPNALQPNAVIFSRTEGSNSFVVGMNNGVPYVEVKNGGADQRSGEGAAVAANTWHHLAVVASGQAISTYLDGEPYGAPVSASLPALNSPSTLGADTSADAPGVLGFNGDIDELNIAKVARSSGYIKLAALSQGGEKAARLITYGPEEAPTNWLSWLKSGTFGVIISSLTVDGWVVICLLAVMAVLSWWVMVSKVGYLNGITVGNEQFMKHWREVASDLTVLDGGDPEKTRTLGGRLTPDAAKKLRLSSVYRIYHIGAEEIRHRLDVDRARGVARGLAGRSIQAIRASLDGGLVRETQKINKLIVILTICISGGPFLGLLGTVVGVMITFAAVAAAGEVNVNAIAPGIAAALLATVAGLAVAIPSLFGYNYILSRVKDAKDDMHIFIDEFVTKMAEFYKEKAD